MVNHNEILESLLSGSISIDYNGKSWANNFIEGDIFQLWEVLSTKKTKYPLIWLQSGYTVKESNLPGNNQKNLENCNFYLITKGDSHDLNKKRYIDTYKYIIYPLLEKFKSVVSKSKGIRLGNDYEYVTFPFNNVSELENKSSRSKPQTSTLSDIWDALYLNVDITINGDCYPEFKI
jgi:hypothetical protein